MIIHVKSQDVFDPPGQVAKYDYEYNRCGVCNVFMACEPLAGKRYETFQPDRAKALWDRFEFVYTPKHGSWLNMAEIELNVLTGQCLNRRINNIEDVWKETMAWQKYRNNKNAKVNWQFTSHDARIKLSRLYPTLDA